MTAAACPSLPVAIGIELLLALEQRGVAVRVDLQQFDLVVTPAHLLSEREVEEIGRNFEAVMVAALLMCDAGVRVRHRVYMKDPGSNLLVPDIRYEPGTCFSCGADAPPHRGRPARCWRCRTAYLVAIHS